MSACPVMLPAPIELLESYDTIQKGTRIAVVSWLVDVQPGKYLALSFTAKNPDGAKDVRWSVRQHLADGSLFEWSDKLGAKERPR